MSLAEALVEGTVRVVSARQIGRDNFPALSVAIATLERGSAAGVSEWTLDPLGGNGSDAAWSEIAAQLDGANVAGEGLQTLFSRFSPYAERPERLPAFGHELCRLCLALPGQEGVARAEVTPTELSVRLGLRPDDRALDDCGTRERAILLAELLVAVANEARPGGLEVMDQALWRDRRKTAAAEARP